MRPKSKAMLARSFKDLSRFVLRERAALPEDIDEVCQLLGLRDHLLTDQANVFLAIVTELGWNYVRTQQRGDDRSWKLCCGIANGFERLDLRLDRQPITRLGFDRGS